MKILDVLNRKVNNIKSNTKNNVNYSIDIMENDPNKVWAFCAGQYSNDFRGNPKYLFIYMNQYRKDIFTYWLCSDIDTINQIRKLGFRAYQLGTVEAELAMNKTGVLVAEQVKMTVPKGLEHAKYLNLWHGVGGVKAVEKSLTEGRLAFELAKKYIAKNEYYTNNELYLAPSSFIEEIAKEQLGITEDRIIRAGYPRNIYQKNFEKISTFDGDLVKKRKLPDDTKIIVYAPTYRNNQVGELFSSAISDMDRLIQVCQRKHLLMIFKMHPLLENEMGFLQAKETYSNCPWVCFWDNKDDFYEIIDQVDLCIMDFSSMFTDFLAAGVKYYIRYVFDIDLNSLEFPLDYDEATLGKKCLTYDELLETLENYEEMDLSKDIERINKLYWEFSDKDSLDKIIEDTINFIPKKEKLPTLYSFDIFDTLISRKGLEPESIFYWVKEQMEKSELEYPQYVIKNYPAIRQSCEKNCREYYNRSKVERDDERCEIQFEYIFNRMKKLYNLSSVQIEKLKEWELEAEYNDSIPLKEQVEKVKQLVDNGETVVLVSDMYLSTEFVKKLLTKADPILGTLPLYLSSEYGFQKSAKTLYLEVYKSFAPNYMFGKWVHHGDNEHSDIKMAESLNIQSVQIEKPSFNELEMTFVKEVGTYDSYLVASLLARFRTEHPLLKEQFAYSYVSFLFVPYVYWAIHDALERGDKILYFVSRDGHHLKRIADVIIEAEQLPIETKYIYASRRTWRIPSFIDHIDIGFWGQGYGNFGKISSFGKMLKALNMTEEDFRKVFPELSDINEQTEFDTKFVLQIVDIFKSSKKYEEFLLEKAAEERKTVCGYLKQEIDEEKQFSIVEYWGRGYTQENFTRLWQFITKKEEPSVFYYSRSTLPSDENNIRKNFTCNPNAQQFVEAIFANMPYKSIEEYRLENNKWVPEIKELECDFELFEAMQECLPKFADDYCRLEVNDRDSIGRTMIDFAINYYYENQKDSLFVENLAHLMDSVELYGNKIEYAKELTTEDLELVKQKTPWGRITKSVSMSLERATKDVQEQYYEMYQLKHGELRKKEPLISDEKIKKNKKFYEERCAQQKKNYAFKIAYERACNDENVKNKVLFLYEGGKFEQAAFKKISEILNNQDVFEVEKISMKLYIGSMTELAKKIASARFILVDKSVALLGGLKLRQETKLIMLGDRACYLLPEGLLKKIDLRREKELHMLNSQMDISVLQTPSDKMTEIYKKCYSVNVLTDYTLKGKCITDVYFDSVFKKKAKEKLVKLFPEAANKKVICYIPHHRYRETEAGYAEMLDLQLMQQYLGDEYVIIIHKQNKNGRVINNILEIPGFSKDLTNKMKDREQLVAADIVIGDYRDVTFEVPLMHKPLFLTCSDFKEKKYRKRVLFDYEELSKGIAVDNTIDLIHKINEIDLYDYSYIENFVEKYLTSCDGKSSERLYEYMCDNRIGR